MLPDKNIQAYSSHGEQGGAGRTTTQSVEALAEEFMAALSAEELEALQYDFNEASTAVWSNLPIRDAARHGLRLGDLEGKSLKAAHALAEAALSAEGYKTMTEIIRADEYLRQDAGGMQWGSELYYIAIYGKPSANTPWMLQITGHHLAVNLVFNGKQTSATPMFVGVEPQSFKADAAEVEAMAGRIGALAAFLNTLSTSELGAAAIEGEIGDIILGPGKDRDFPEAPQGLAASALSQEQRDLIGHAIASWVMAAHADTAKELLEAYLSEEAINQTYIGWNGSSDVMNSKSYIRIDGPRVWIELAGLQGAAYRDKVQIHTIWRDKAADYGACFGLQENGHSEQIK
ncbi:DUF3500 domain-containing protein [Paenibacillus sepulcri]